MPRARVILVHSGGFTSRQWRRLVEQLAPAYEVIAPDLVGYGAAGPWPDGAPFHFRQDVAHVAAILGDAPAHVVAHSYGGFVALHLALARPAQVRSLALYEPVAPGTLVPGADDDAIADLDRIGLTWRDGAWLGDFVDWWNGGGAWAALPEDTRAAMRAVGWKVFQEVATLRADPTDGAGFAAIAAPTLLMRGDRTPLAAQRMIARLAEAIPRAELRTFEGMGHMGPITHAPVVNAAIAAWLAQRQAP